MRVADESSAITGPLKVSSTLAVRETVASAAGVADTSWVCADAAKGRAAVTRAAANAAVTMDFIAISRELSLEYAACPNAPHAAAMRGLPVSRVTGDMNGGSMVMHTDIDDALAGLAAVSAHRGLSGLEDRVLGAIASRRTDAIGARTTLAAASLALALGVASNAVPVDDAATSLSPLGASLMLAPSTLLAG
jgi:hypothetical protein